MSVSPATKNAEAAEGGHFRPPQAQDPPKLTQCGDDDTATTASLDEVGETHTSSTRTFSLATAFARVRAIAAAVWALVFARAIAMCCCFSGKKRRSSFDAEGELQCGTPERQQTAEPFTPTDEERTRLREERLAAAEGRLSKCEKKAMRRKKKSPANDKPLRGPLSRNTMRWTRG